MVSRLRVRELALITATLPPAGPRHGNDSGITTNNHRDGSDVWGSGDA
jgi:hypothetical protein